MEPKISISVLVDYILAPTASARRAILKSIKSRLGSAYFAPYYNTARQTLRAYHSGNKAALPATIISLRNQLKEPRKPQHRARLEHNLRVLGDYRARFQGIEFEHTGKRFQALPIGGVLITAEPTLSGLLTENGSTIQANVVVECDEIIPSGPMANYTTELIFLASGETYKTDPRGAQLWHPSSGSQWYLERHVPKRLREIRAACEEIAARWPGV